MKYIKRILGNLFAWIGLFLMLVFIPIGFVYGACRRGFERGTDIGDDPTQLIL